MSAPTSIEQRHYQQIAGGTITGIAWDVDSFTHPAPVLMVRMPSGTKLQCAVLCDPEGNGPGFIEIVPEGK